MLEMSIPLFSKFHHSLDENNNLCFLFAFSPLVLGEGNNLLSAEVYRQSSLPMGANALAANLPPAVKVYTEFVNLKIKNGENLIYIGGMDKNITIGHNYQYTVVMHVKKNKKEKGKPTFYNTSKSIMSNKSPWIPPKAVPLEHKFPVIETEKPDQLNVDFIDNEMGFNYLSKEAYDEGALTAPAVSLLGDRQMSLLKNNVFAATSKFSEIINRSIIPVSLENFIVGSCPPELSPSSEIILSKQELIEISIAAPARAINFEYLSEFTNSITTENWQPIDAGVVGALDAGDRVLIRLSNPENYTNKYFYISGEE
jgi:hypothetical protein